MADLNVQPRTRARSMDGSKKWTVVITGAAGFLGSTILKLINERCSEEIKTIRGFDIRFVEMNEPARRQSRDSRSGIVIEYCQGDICDYNKVRDSLTDADVVIHCASYNDFGPDEENSYKILNTNIRGTEHIVKACKENRVPFLIYTSTYEVAIKKHQFYHITGDESLPTYSYLNDYAMLDSYTKAIAEGLIFNANDTFIGTDKLGRPLKLLTCALRPVEIYGEGQEHYLIPDLLKQAKKLRGVVPKIGWNPEPFQVAYVGNIAWAHIKAMETFMTNPESMAGKAYFVTDDTPSVPYVKLSEPYLSAFGYRFTGITIPFTFLYLLLLVFEMIVWLLKPIYLLRLTLDRHKIVRVCYGHTFSRNSLQKDTGYAPCYTPEESFKRTVRYYAENPPK